MIENESDAENHDPPELPSEVVNWWTELSNALPAPWYEGADLPSIAGVDPTDRTVAASSRMLCAAVALLLESGRDNLLEVLTAQRLARRAEASRQTVHNTFKDQDVLAALAQFVADPEVAQRNTMMFDLAVDWFTSNSEQGAWSQQLRTLVLATFDLSRRDPVYAVQLLLNATAPHDAEVQKAILAYRRELLAGATPVWRKLSDHNQVEPYTPHSYESFAEALSALTDGFILRSYVDPSIGPQQFADAAGALYAGMFIPRGSTPEDAGSLHSSMAHQPPTVDPLVVSNDYLVDCALAFFEHKGTANVTLEDLSLAAGYTVETLRRRYGSVANFVSENWTARVMPDVQLAASTSTTPMKRLSLVLDLLCERARDNYWLTAAYLRVVHTGDEQSVLARQVQPEIVAEVLRELLLEAREATRAGQRGGMIDTNDETVCALAKTLAWNALSSVLRPPLTEAPHQYAPRKADLSLQLLVNGIRA